MSLFKLIRNERAATAIEYALIAAIISLAAIVAMRSIGSTIGNTFNTVSGNMH